MKTQKVPRAAAVAVLAMATLAGMQACRAAAYTLLPASTLVDECPPCASRPTIPEPMRGTFELRLVEEHPLFTRYAVEDIAFVAGSPAGRAYKVTGRGQYTVGGEVLPRQDLSLEVVVDDGTTARTCHLTNAVPEVGRLFPVLEGTAVQSDGTPTQVYHLHLFAAPFRELWFSTVSGMTPSNGGVPSGHIGGGDLLSSSGRVVRTNPALMARMGRMPSPDPEDVGLDTVQVLGGGEIAFSASRDSFSELLGPLQHGDLLSDRGRVLLRNQQLTAAFGQMPVVPDNGLDAFQSMPGGEVWFSVRQDFFSEPLGRTVGKGDVLSDRGRVVKSNAELLKPFQPADPGVDHGLDALHVWPSGEIWFSVETRFHGPHFEPYGDGDILSDQGYVVWRNLDLLNPFAPLEDLADFGLDALHVVTDVAPATAVGPEFTGIRRLASGAVALAWAGKGRTWQVERAPAPEGPWRAVGPVTADTGWEDASPGPGPVFYRLRQW